MTTTITFEEQITLVQNSYGRCLASGDVLDTFYQNFLAASPIVKEKFAHTDFENQKKLLKHGLNLMIMFAADNIAGKAGLKRIQTSHDHRHLNIKPEFYKLWKNCLLDAVEKHDYKFNEGIAEAWSEVLEKGMRYIKSGY